MIISKKHNTIVAGPCSAESFSQVDSIASKIHKNIDFFRAGVWKPRTNINSFQGVGEVGLSWLKQIKDKYNIKVACEVANSKHVELCKKFKIDMVWLGARTTVNPFYVQEIAESLQDSKIHVYIKNPIIPDMDLWYNAIKRMQSYNIKNIGAIHRGFYVERKINYRNKPKWSAVKEFRKKIKGINLICDCSHIAGDSSIVKELVLKSQKLKYDGVMIETHNTPEKALSDSKQQIKPVEFNSFFINE